MGAGYTVFWLIVAVIFAFITASVAKKKGYSYGGFWVLGFFFGLIALIIAACLSDKTKQQTPYAPTQPYGHQQPYAPPVAPPPYSVPQPQPVARPVQVAIDKTCPYCGTRFPADKTTCDSCGARI